MKTKVFSLIVIIIVIVSACNRGENDDFKVQIPDFNFPKSITFEDSLSAYNIFQGAPQNMIPSSDFHELELSSVLFTDYAHKQRLVKIPGGTQMVKQNDGKIEFPDGTILTKTFYYFLNEGDTSLGKNIIETRLLIKENNLWNVATYRWNDAQTAATLVLDGFTKQVSWVDVNGITKSTMYQMPTENECMTCHQSNSSMTPIGPSILNLNRLVNRNGTTLNQLDHLQAIGILSNFSPSLEPEMVDYKDQSNTLDERGRAYLAMNCAHCHNPAAWDIPADKNFDFRYETPFAQTGILNGKDKIFRNVVEQDMPFIGTTMPDQEGINLLTNYLNSL